MAVDVRVGVDLHILNRALEARAYDAVVAAGFADITAAQARLLARVDEGGSRLVELADRARVTKQTASHLVEQLERAGYVDRVPDPTDGRARLVRLTKRAREAVPAANAEVVAALAEWRAHVGPARMDELAGTLARLAALVEAAAL